MYENNPDQSWLYPGDIICDLNLPNLKTDAFQMVSHNDGQKYSVRLMMTNKYFVYLSHECDYNDDKRQFFLLTPMLGIDQKIRRSKDNFDRVISSNDVKQHPHYLNQFYFEPNPPVFPEDKVIDFTRIISFSVKEKDGLLKNKCSQLKQEIRNLLKTKMGYYFVHSQQVTPKNSLR